MEIRLSVMTKNTKKKQKQHFLQHKEKHKNTKDYTDRSKSIEKKIGLQQYSKKAFIHSAEYTTIKKTLKEFHNKFIIYTDSQSSMQSI